MDWMRLLTNDERAILRWALADQDRNLAREGEVSYYRNVVPDEDTGRIVELERVRTKIIQAL